MNALRITVFINTLYAPANCCELFDHGFWSAICFGAVSDTLSGGPLES
jgi:hypothetical protein